VHTASLILATGFGSGYFPIAPATFASALVALAAWLFWPVSPVREAVLIAALIPLAIWSAELAERRLGHDAHPIVIDEFAGQLVALWAVPREPVLVLAAFLLFRLFDIWKPLGASALQRLPGGTGIVADDLLAGVYARLVVQALIVLFPVFGRSGGVV
jgi:phosphatidylglycerophosphatase A